MDPQTFLGIATTVTKLKMWPYFDISHFILMCLSVRDDVQQSGTTAFSRKHPLACYVSCMIMCFAGGILSNLLLGEPALSPFKNERNIAVASLVWYLIFYSPFDIVYKFVNFLPVRLILVALKEVQRTKNVYDGVQGAIKLYPGEHVIMFILGIIKGNAYGFIRPLERAIRGLWIPTLNEFLMPSFILKGSAIASVIFILEHENIIRAPHALLYFGVVIFLVYFRLSAVVFGVQDPCLPFENLFCSIFMGGMWDAFKRSRVPETADNDVNKNDVKNKEEKKKD